MPLTISNNSAVAAASYHLGKNQSLLQLSIKKLASGKKIISPNDDPGTLSVSMKLNASVTRLNGARNNVQNAISFLEVQDGILENAGRIVNRMAELKGMSSQDPMKSAQDIESYDNEFHDLQRQLYDISQMTFNGSSLFAQTSNTGANTIFKVSGNHTISIHTSDQGNSGTKISLHQAALLSALTITNNGTTMVSTAFNDTTNRHTGSGAVAATDNLFSFAAATATDAWDLNSVSMGVFQKALENVAFLRAQNGGGMSRLTFSADSLSVQQTNIRAALGRIEDVDIAEESANLSKYSILTQAAAAMVSQANSTNDVALMLLR
ncbi:flagellin [Opitutales bacterium]|nr:flagellin [Opitutales bacterium]